MAAQGRPLQDKVAVVTGASSGIGAAVAEELARAGAAVALGARRGDRLAALAERIRGEGGAALVQVTDVRKRADVDALVGDALETWGRLDILVNNAGVMPLSPITELDVEGWEAMLDVNVRGVLYGVAAALGPMMIQGGGHVVNIGSVAGRRPFPGATVYAATKFAVRALSWGMHLELGSAHGIRVTDVQPGYVETELLDDVPDPETRRAFEASWAERRPLQPADVARAVLHAVTAPEHVAVSEILVRPVDQPT